MTRLTTEDQRNVRNAKMFRWLWFWWLLNISFRYTYAAWLVASGTYLLSDINPIPCGGGGVALACPNMTKYRYGKYRFTKYRTLVIQRQISKSQNIDSVKYLWNKISIWQSIENKVSYWEDILLPTSGWGLSHLRLNGVIIKIPSNSKAKRIGRTRKKQSKAQQKLRWNCFSHFFR